VIGGKLGTPVLWPCIGPNCNVEYQSVGGESVCGVHVDKTEIQWVT